MPSSFPNQFRPQLLFLCSIQLFQTFLLSNLVFQIIQTPHHKEKVENKNKKIQFLRFEKMLNSLFKSSPFVSKLERKVNGNHLRSASWEGFGCKGMKMGIWKGIRIWKESCLFSTKVGKENSTIFALSSGSGTCGVNVVRVSGPQSHSILKNLLGEEESFPKQTNKLYLRRVYEVEEENKKREMLDKCFVVKFDGPKSFTGEDSFELHLHGSESVLIDCFSSLEKLGARQAVAGEFSRRALQNGKIDLIELEALSDLISSQTSQQRKQSLRQLEGELGLLYKKWTQTTVKCLAHVEAVIDFADDELIEEETLFKVKPILSSLLIEMKNHLNDGNRGEILRNGIFLSIHGPPNAGPFFLRNFSNQFFKLF